MVIAVAPNLLGFAFAGGAIFLAMGNEHFNLLIRGFHKKNESSYAMKVLAALTHFLLILFLALFSAVLGNALDWEGCIFRCWNVFLFCYGLLLIPATVLNNLTHEDLFEKILLSGENKQIVKNWQKNLEQDEQKKHVEE